MCEGWRVYLQGLPVLSVADAWLGLRSGTRREGVCVCVCVCEGWRVYLQGLLCV